MITGKQMDYLGLALYCQNVVDALLGFLQGEKVKELEEKMNSAADLMVWLGTEFVPEFKETADSWRKSGKKWQSYDYGSRTTPLHYEHYLIFEKAVRDGSHQDRLAELRKGLLRLLDLTIDLDAKKEGAEACLYFFSDLLTACLYAFRRERFDH